MTHDVPPRASTAWPLRVLRRLLVCYRGHSYMLKLSPEVVWLECAHCLTVRVIDARRTADVA